MTFGISCHVLHSARSPSHLIVILGDDIGWNEVSWHNPGIKTPHLQVKEGLVIVDEEGWCVCNCVSEACKRWRATDPVLHYAQVLPQQGCPHDRPLPLEDWDAAGSHREVQHVNVTLSKPAHEVLSPGSSRTVSTPASSCCPSTYRRQAMPPTLWASGTWGTATPPTFPQGRGPLEKF